MHGVVKANGHATWIWRGRPEDHPLSVQRRKRDRERVLQRERQVFEGLVVGVAAVLKRGRLSKFEHEATCRYTVRIRFIFEGRSWGLSDHLAAMVVRDALRSINARRPQFVQGQANYTALPGSGLHFHRCEWCGSVLPEDRPRFCSRICSQASSNDRQYHERRLLTAPEREQANRLRQHERKEQFAAARTIECGWCGAPHTPPPMAGPRTYCGKSCAAKARWAKRKAAEAVELPAG